MVALVSVLLMHPVNVPVCYVWNPSDVLDVNVLGIHFHHPMPKWKNNQSTRMP